MPTPFDKAMIALACVCAAGISGNALRDTRALAAPDVQDINALALTEGLLVSTGAFIAAQGDNHTRAQAALIVGDYYTRTQWNDLSKTYVEMLEAVTPEVIGERGELVQTVAALQRMEIDAMREIKKRELTERNSRDAD